MLLEFRVSNYRSFRDEQCLSLVPIGKDDSLAQTNIHAPENSAASAALKSCAIYGPNASGKSNLLQAMLIMQLIIRDSATTVRAGQTLNVQPFALDAKHSKAPCSFEITVHVDGVRWQYGFSVAPERIYEEWLLVYKSARAQEWFSRRWNQKSGQYEYSFSSYFLGGKEIWKNATRDNALFLSTAIQLNNEQLRPLWDWLVSSWVIIPAQVPLNIDLTVNAIEKSARKATVLEFLNSADLGIADVDVVRQKGKLSSFTIDTATGKMVNTEPVETEMRIPRLKHSGEAGEALFNLDQESQGTQRFFAFAGIILSILERGRTLVVDELENSMHLLLVRHIIGLFQSSQTNPRGAQLVFSTHNTSLLDKELFRRDQIWFTEKGADLGTVLVPLSEFSARKTEAFEKGYLDGRYGALPIIRAYNGESVADAGK